MFVQALPTLSFGQAIKTCFTKFCTFSGRARRSEYWLFNIFIQIITSIIIIPLIFIFIAICTPTTYYDYNTHSYRQKQTTLGAGFFIVLIITLFIFLVLSIPILSASVRRLHDTGKSGCYLLLGFIPFGSIALLIFFIEDSQQTTNEYGPSPKYIAIQGDPLMNNSMAIPVAGIPNVNPNPVIVQGYVPNPYPYPVQQYVQYVPQNVQYPPQNVPVPSQQNLYQGNAQEVQGAAPNTQEQLATPMVVP